MNLTEKIREFRELKRMSEELLKMADSIADELKAHMIETNQTMMIIGEYRLSYNEISRIDIDKQRLKDEQEEIFAKYSYIKRYKRFLVS